MDKLFDISGFFFNRIDWKEGFFEPDGLEMGEYAVRQADKFMNNLFTIPKENQSAYTAMILRNIVNCYDGEYRKEADPQIEFYVSEKRFSSLVHDMCNCCIWAIFELLGKHLPGLIDTLPREIVEHDLIQNCETFPGIAKKKRWQGQSLTQTNEDKFNSSYKAIAIYLRRLCKKGYLKECNIATTNRNQQGLSTDIQCYKPTRKGYRNIARLNNNHYGYILKKLLEETRIARDRWSLVMGIPNIGKSACKLDDEIILDSLIEDIKNVMR